MFTFSQSSLYEGLLSDYRCPCHPCCLEDISLPFFFTIIGGLLQVWI